MKKKTKIELAGAAALAVSAAGIYYFLGSDEAANYRKRAAEWMRKTEEEIINEAKRLKKVAGDEGNYKEIASKVTEKYRALKNLDQEEVKNFAAVVTKAWKDMQKKSVKKSSRPASKSKK